MGKLAASQRERLWHIDFLARFRGQLTRHDLADRFQIALSNATRDFKVYGELPPITSIATTAAALIGAPSSFSHYLATTANTPCKR